LCITTPCSCPYPAKASFWSPGLSGSLARSLVPPLLRRLLLSRWSHAPRYVVEREGHAAVRAVENSKKGMRRDFASEKSLKQASVATDSYRAVAQHGQPLPLDGSASFPCSWWNDRYRYMETGQRCARLACTPHRSRRRQSSTLPKCPIALECNLYVR